MEMKKSASLNLKDRSTNFLNYVKTEKKKPKKQTEPLKVQFSKVGVEYWWLNSLS